MWDTTSRTQLNYRHLQHLLGKRLLINFITAIQKHHITQCTQPARFMERLEQCSVTGCDTPSFMPAEIYSSLTLDTIAKSRRGSRTLLAVLWACHLDQHVVVQVNHITPAREIPQTTVPHSRNSRDSTPTASNCSFSVQTTFWRLVGCWDTHYTQVVVHGFLCTWRKSEKK